MTTAAEYLERAQQCVQLSQNARLQDRMAILEIAEAWTKLANQAEINRSAVMVALPEMETTCSR